MTRTVIQSDDIASGAIPESGLASVQTFTSSGTYTKPSGITKVMVEVQGAGGGGAGSGPDYYGSGSGGGYAKKLLDVSSISTSTITVGSGGAAVSAGVGTGNNGGNSSWTDGTNTITGNGGLGYTGAYRAKVHGGTGVGGDLNIKGGSGGYYGGVFISHLGVSLEKNDVGYGCAGENGYSSYASGAGGDGIVIVTEYK